MNSTEPALCPRWISIYHWLVGFLVLAFGLVVGLPPLALGIVLALRLPTEHEWPPGREGYVALVCGWGAVALGTWYLVSAYAMTDGAPWGARAARALHVLVMTIGACVVLPFYAYCGYLIVAGAPRGPGFVISDGVMGLAYAVLCCPALGLVVGSWRCWLGLPRGSSGAGA